MLRVVRVSMRMVIRVGRESQLAVGVLVPWKSGVALRIVAHSHFSL